MLWPNHTNKTSYLLIKQFKGDIDQSYNKLYNRCTIVSNNRDVIICVITETSRISTFYDSSGNVGIT